MALPTERLKTLMQEGTRDGASCGTTQDPDAGRGV